MRNKSDENWKVVVLCLQYETLNAAASRLYYAVFQAVLAFAKAKKGYVYNPHISVHIAMRNYVNDALGKDLERVFRKLLALRQTADYEPETPTAPNIKSLMPESGIIRNHFLKLAGS